jgi:hypothetical protein
VTDATPLDAEQLAAYLALKEVSSLLEHAVEKQLKDDGDLTGPQFQILARLRAAPAGHLRIADLATITRILGRVRDRMRTAPPRSAAARPERGSSTRQSG